MFCLLHHLKNCNFRCQKFLSFIFYFLDFFYSTLLKASRYSFCGTLFGVSCMYILFGTGFLSTGPFIFSKTNLLKNILIMFLEWYLSGVARVIRSSKDLTGVVRVILSLDFPLATHVLERFIRPMHHLMSSLVHSKTTFNIYLRLVYHTFEVFFDKNVFAHCKFIHPPV